ncbi:BEN domain-containing protein 5-like [Amblyomma americanum]
MAPGPLQNHPGGVLGVSGQASTSMAPGPLQNHPGGVLGVSGQASTSMAPAPLQDHPGALVEVSGQVHLGNGMYVSAERWRWLLSRGRDSLFCKDTAKLLWGVSNLRGKSVTGAACRRFLKAGATQKPGLTPEKLAAVGNAFDAYIIANPTAEDQKARRGKMNRFLADMLRDIK